MKPDLGPGFILGTEGHQGPLTCVATNQDGSLILTGSVDCQAKLVSATTGKVSWPGGWLWSLCCPNPLPFLSHSSLGLLSSPPFFTEASL